MAKVELTMQADRFTKMSELVREIGAFLEANPHYKLQVLIPASRAEELESEIGAWRTLGRVKVLLESGTQEELFSEES